MKKPLFYSNFKFLKKKESKSIKEYDKKFLNIKSIQTPKWNPFWSFIKASY